MCSASSTASILSSRIGAGSSWSLGPSATRKRAGSALASRSVSARRHEPPSTSRADSASFRNGRPARSGRASRRSSSEPSARRSVSSFPTASGKTRTSASSAAGLRPRTLRLPPAAGEPPRLPPVDAEPLRDRAARELRELPDPAHSEPFELRVALARHGQKRERERLEERLLLLLRDEQDLTRPRHARRRECGEAPPRRSDARIPGRADGLQRALESRLPPPYSRSTPRVSKTTTPCSTGSTANPASSRRRKTPSHSRSTAAGSRSTSTSDGHVASASPSRIPGLTPAASAIEVTGPSSGSSPASGASAAGSSASLGRARSAALSSNPGMRRHAIIRTHVLYEHVFSCQAEIVINQARASPLRASRDAADDSRRSHS